MNPEMDPPAPPLKTRVLFWVLLGLFSAILAEVVSFSSPNVFLTTWGLLVVFPLYSLHILVLAYLIFKSRRLSLSILFLAGMIFGLYEAYITKVLWSPTWGSPGPVVGGVALVQTAVLVLFWHPWMAFILPLMTAERILTGSSEVFLALPAGLRQKMGSRQGRILSICTFAGFCAIYQGLNAPSVGAVLFADLQAALVFWAGLALWRRAVRGRVYSLRQLLPSGKPLFVLALLLAANYLWQGILIRPEALPRALGPHLTIACFYLLTGSLLWIHIRQASSTGSPETSPPAPVGQGVLLLFFAVWMGCAALLTLLKPAAVLGVSVSWGVGVLLGLVLLSGAILGSFKPLAGRSA